MDIKKLLNTLHPLERKVLPLLAVYTTINKLAEHSGLQEVEIMRALQWLQNKGIIKIKEDIKEIASLDHNGIKYLKKGLPEKRFLEALSDKPLSLPAIQKKASLAREELNICIGTLKIKAAINIMKEKGLAFSITEQGQLLLKKGFLEEDFLRKKFPIEVNSLKPEEKFSFQNLRKRKHILTVTLKKIKLPELTELGRTLVKKKIDSNVIDTLTSSMLRDGSWKNKNFRRFDIKINVPKIFAGRKQHYRGFLDEIRLKFISLGFKEMFGPIVETNFWNMDSLFMPQFHSARDIHDAYYIIRPKYGKLDSQLVKKVKASHENGFKTGSKGWQYKFDEKRTHRRLLRTQGTACSARMLASKQLEIPGKYFAIARCFRPDVVDATHNCDFFQTEGIVVEDGLNFSHLKGLLRMFAEEFCQTNQIKIVPAYFPFTEPSAELHAKHPDLGWIELAGAGIFRKELTKPLGVDVPVLAWGIGIDRIAMFKLKIKDIRQLFSHDLQFLRNTKI